MDQVSSLMGMLEGMSANLVTRSSVWSCFFISVGAGIVVGDLYVPTLFSKLLKNPLCSLLLKDSSDFSNRSSNFDVSYE